MTVYDFEQNTLCADLINEIFLDHLNNIKNKCFIILINNQIKYVNNYFLELTGYNKSEIFEVPFITFIPEHIQTQTITSIEQSNFDKTKHHISIICSNREILVFKINGKQIFQDDIKLVFLELTPIISEFVESNNPDHELYHSVLNSVSENIFIVDKELFIIQSIKIKSEKFNTVLSLSDIFSSVAIKQIKKNVMKEWQNNNARFFEIQNYKKYYEGRLVPYRKEYFVFAFNEISLRKRIENKLIDSQIQLRELNNEKDLLLSIIAHDLKNPFNVINGFCSVLLKSGKNFTTEKKDEIIEHIYTASLSGHNLLENLLEWSRSQSERIIFEPRNLELKEICEHIISFYSINIVNKKLIIDNKIKNKINVCADKNMLSTILRNLISNAIKFTPEKGIIEISAQKTTNNLVQITVKDSGIGLSKKQMSTLFLVGKNYSTNGTDGEKGSGLGLLLCKEFIEKHKGTIQVKSSPGNGCEFIFCLPVVST